MGPRPPLEVFSGGEAKAVRPKGLRSFYDSGPGLRRLLGTRFLRRCAFGFRRVLRQAAA